MNQYPGPLDPTTSALLRAVVRRVRERSTDPRADLLLLASLAVTAGRPSEVLNLTRGDVDEQRCLVRLAGGKASARWLPVPDYLARELAYFAVERGQGKASDRVFVARGRAGGSHEITYARLRRMLAGYPRSTDAVQPTLAITASGLRRRTVGLVAIHCPGALPDLLGRPRPVGSHVRGDVAVALAIVELFGGDHPLLHGSPGHPL